MPKAFCPALMVGVLTPEQQNRSRQITKLEGGFVALNATESFA